MNDATDRIATEGAQCCAGPSEGRPRGGSEAIARVSCGSARADGSREKARRAMGERARTAAGLALVVAVTILLLHRRSGQDSFAYSDASRHAMDGIFVIDALRDGGLAEPYSYGLHYAAKYPALGVVYYPPLFALVEAAVYAVAGYSLAAARATVVLFGIVGVAAAYLHGRAARGRSFGLMAALCFIMMPEVVYWGHDVMLEVPVAAMVLLTGYFLHQWAVGGRPRAGYACAASLLGAVLTKQSAALMFPVVFFYLLASRRWRLLWSREAIVSYVLGALILVPYALFQWHYYGSVAKLAARGVAITGVADPGRWFLLAHHLPKVASWPLLVLAAAGLAASVVRWREGLSLYLLVWFAVAYLFSAYAMAGSVRYLFLVFPAVAFLAAEGLHAVVPRRLGRVPSRAVCIVAVLAYQGWVAARATVPRVSAGYRRAAELVVSEPRGETVVFHGRLSGNFIFHARVADVRRRLIILRSDKLFGRLHRVGEHVTNMAKGTFAPDVETVADVRRLLREHGVGHVVVDPGRGSSADAITPLLLEAVAQPPWSLRASVPVAYSGQHTAFHGEIRIYENPRAGRATADSIPFWVPFCRARLRPTYARVRRLGG